MRLTRLACLLIVLTCAFPNHVTGGEKPNLNPTQQKVNEQRSETRNQERPKAEKKQESTDATIKPTPTPSPPTAQISQSRTKQEQSPADGTKDTNRVQKDKNWFDWYAAVGPSTWADWVAAVLAFFAE